MRICLFHPKRLPPKDYGGVERVVLWLASGLRERGHEVWVAALEGSDLPVGVRLLPVRPDRTSAHDLLPLLPSGLDVVHFMAPPEAGVLERLPCPGILTVHGNGKPGERYPCNTVFLSEDHARRHGAKTFVYNGVDPAEYRFDPKRAKANGFVFLSKTSWSVKNVAGAMRLCTRAAVPLKIAGGARPWSRRLQALLSPRFTWVGPVAGEGKAELLAQARALVFPVLWPEPFGLVVVEALMSGTPVIASRCGSLPELIPADVGALLERPETRGAEARWVEALRAAYAKSPWQPERCREWAMEKFSHLKMAEGYETAYKRVIRGESLQESEPVASDWKAQPNRGAFSLPGAF